nr:hypothetical protein Iba_scaffold35592CG0030 [Ipomoea batatas]
MNHVLQHTIHNNSCNFQFVAINNAEPSRIIPSTKPSGEASTKKPYLNSNTTLIIGNYCFNCVELHIHCSDECRVRMSANLIKEYVEDDKVGDPLTIDDGNCYNINTKVLDWHLGLEIEAQPKLYMEVDKSCEGIVSRKCHDTRENQSQGKEFVPTGISHILIPKRDDYFKSEEVERCVGEPQLLKAMEEVAKGGELDLKEALKSKVHKIDQLIEESVKLHQDLLDLHNTKEKEATRTQAQGFTSINAESWFLVVVEK